MVFLKESTQLYIHVRHQEAYDWVKMMGLACYPINSTIQAIWCDQLISPTPGGLQPPVGVGNQLPLLHTMGTASEDSKKYQGVKRRAWGYT